MPTGPRISQSSMMEGPPSRNPSYMTPDYKIHLLNKRLMEASEDCDNLWWDALACEFFEDKATLTVSFFAEDGRKQYTIGRTLIPRYFRSIFDGGASELYMILRHTKDMFNHAMHSISVDCDNTTMVTNHVKPVLTKVYTDGHLLIEFSCDDMMRIRQWHFEIHSHSELVSKQMLIQEPVSVEKFGGSITKQGMSPATINYLKLCVILEPMKEIMSRHKTYNIDPRDCLRNCLFQKWQRMMTPSDPPRGNKRPSRKRKNSSSTNPANQILPLKKKNFTSDVMVVGEPSLMGGEFGDEDERMITRLENQCGSGPIKTEQESGMTSFPHTTSPSVRPGSSHISPWQARSQITPQSVANGSSLACSIAAGSGPPSQDSSLSEHNEHETMPSTTISAPN